MLIAQPRHYALREAAFPVLGPRGITISAISGID